MPLPIILYLALCLMTAYLGRRTRLGFFRTLLFSVVLTPLLMVVYLLIYMSVESESQPLPDNQDKDHPR